MQAGEVKPYFDNLQAELANEPDPRNRIWYETEASFTPEYQEATELQNLLGRFSADLAEVIEFKVDEEIAGRPENEFAKIEDYNARNDDEYLTPEERKKKSVSIWLSSIVEEYDDATKQANTETKASRKARKQELAQRHFMRHFESFGSGEQHIVYDGEALGYVLDELGNDRKRLATMVVESGVNYLQVNGVEYTESFDSFAHLFKGSVTDKTSAQGFDALLKAVFDKKAFANQPLNAAKLYVNSAHAYFEIQNQTVESDSVTEGMQFPAVVIKMIETINLLNDVIADKEDFASSIVATKILTDKTELGGDLRNADLIFQVLKYAFSDHIANNKITEAWLTSTDFGKAQVAIRALCDHFGISEKSVTVRAREHKEDPFNRGALQPGSSNWFKFDDDGSLIELDGLDTSIPPEHISSHTASRLYEKRVHNLMPIGLTHGVISEAEIEDPSGGENSVINDMMISPSWAISFELYSDGEQSTALSDLLDPMVRPFIKVIPELTKKLEDQASTGYVIHQVGMEDENSSGPSITAILRPSVPLDKLLEDPHQGLMVAFDDIVQETDDEVLQQNIRERKEHIRQHQHNFPGRRPIKFTLPEAYKSKGFHALEIRQHPDWQHLIVTTHHDGGDLTFSYNSNLAYDGALVGESPYLGSVRLVLENLVTSLYAEWACRSVVRTSEGSVSINHENSRVNLGHFSYLPAGANFSERQRAIYRRERGGDLEAESLRRQAEDPTGQGRNSTYVRESYDPTKPPLEVYYDPKVLETE